jgi:hypothetical protein
VLATVRNIAAIAGLPMEEVESDDKRVNVVSKFNDNETAGGVQTCFAQWVRRPDGVIQQVEININFRNWQRIDRCIAHEALHGFGFQSHPHSADSVLSYVSGRSKLTRVDRLLLQALYDRRLRPGTAPEEASRIACRLLAEKIGAALPDIHAVCDSRTGPENQAVAVKPRWLQRSNPASR